MRRLVRLGSLFILCLLVSVPALAQVQTGSILIRAADEQGASVPGANITLTSPVLPRPLTGVTDSTGVYRFQALTIGRYTARITLTGFQTVTREDVVVVQNQTVTVDLTLKLGNVSEEVTVTGETPVVDTKSATVNVNLDSMLLETTPGGKDIWNILEYKIPGLNFTQPDVGGNQAGLQRSFTTRGTPNSQNVQLVNGVNVGDPAAIGFSMNYYEPSTFENIQVTTGAQDISMGTSGVLINMVTRSGTNRFGGETLGTYQGKGTQWDNVDETLKKAGFRPEANAVGFISNFNFQAGGPVVQNKLFYFGSFNDQRTHVNVPGYPAISPPEFAPLTSGNTQDTTDIESISGKLTYALNTSNRFEGYANRQWYDKPNRGAGPTSTLDSNPKEHDTFVITQLSWNTVLTSRLVADTKLAYSNTHFPLSQKTDRQTILDQSTNVRHWNNATSNTMFRRRLQVTSNWNYYISNLVGGRHELRFGVDNGYTPEDVTQERQGDVSLTYRSLPTSTLAAGPQTVTIFNTPSIVKRAVNQTSLYGQDTYSIGRLTVIGGIRWERVEGFIPAQDRLDNQYFPPGLVINGLNVTLNTGGTLTQYVVPDNFAEVRDSPLWKNWAPRVSGTYDLLGTGRSVIKLSAGKYLDQIGTGTPGPNPNGTVQQEYGWNDLDGDLQFDRGNAVWDGFRYVGGEFGAGTVTTSIPNPNPFDRTLRRPYRNEFTAGLDQEVLTGLRLSLTFIHRREHDSQGSVDAEIAEWDNRYTPVTIREPGRDGQFDTGDDATLTVYNLNPGVTVSPRTVNDDRLGVTYNGIEIVGTKRYGNGLTFLAGYTYGKEEVDLVSLNNPNAARVNASGLSGGRRHSLKITGSYLLPYRVTVGWNFNIQSGLPITRTYGVPRCTSSVRTDCVNQNLTINAEPRGSVELPSMTRLDLRAGRLFNVGGQRFEASVDFYNLTNANTVYDVRTGTGLTNVRYANDPNEPISRIATFLSPTGALGPRIIRFNVTYWFGQGASAAGRR